MAGFSNITGDESILFADNASFDGTERGGKLTTNGQLWIGSTASPHVVKGTIGSSDASITVVNGPGTIDLKVAGGTTTVQTLTPNSGAAVNPVAGNIDDKGIAFGSGSTFPLLTRNGGAGVFQIADQTYLSPYVVDYTSSSFGAAGTYSTITAALTQLLADATAKQTIYVRGGSASESVAFPNNTSVTIIGLQSQEWHSFTGPIIQGNWTIGTGCNIRLQNLTVTNGGGSTITQTAGNLYCQDCQIAGAGGPAYTAPALSTGSVVFTNCGCGAITLGGSTHADIISCNVVSPNTITIQNSASAYIQNCQLYDITLADDAILECFDNVWFSGGDIGGTTTQQCYIYNNTFLESSSPPINASFNFNSARNTGVSGIGVVGASATDFPDLTQAGCLYNVRSRSSGTSEPWEQVLLVDTSAPRAINLIPSPYKGQTVTYIDDIGTAGANNITIQGNGHNINGAATYVMNVNYGAATFIYQGTEWRVI